MDKKPIVWASISVIALVVISTAFVAAETGNSNSNRVASVDVEILNVARETGVFLSVQPGNFSAAFSFSPNKSILQVDKVLLTLNWNQNSLGHVGDKFSVELNHHPPTLITMDRFASAVVALNSQDTQVGANEINIGVIPVDPFATQLTTQYQLYEVRATIEYTTVNV